MMRIGTLGLLATVLTACGQSEAQSTRVVQTSVAQTTVKTRSPRFLVLAIDHSGSRTPDQQKADLGLVQQLLQDIETGDRLAIMDVCAGGRSAACRPIEVPVPQGDNRKAYGNPDSVTLAYARQDASRMIRTLITQRPPARSTNLFASLRFVDDLSATVDLPVTLVIFSDMIQAGEGVVLLPEPRIPPPDSVPAPPRLHGVCISAVGAV
ncbi:MAG TPA: hypothetical protein VFK36_08180, partial [Gemmatimonadales bacterium]|nr:hypothetical protein [Gemmatimonadales bacterium]